MCLRLIFCLYGRKMVRTHRCLFLTDSVYFLLTVYEGKGILKEEILDNIDKESGFLQRKKILLNNTALQEGK